MKHEASKGEVVESGKGLGETFVVASQTAEPRRPRERSFNHPATGKEDEATLGLGMLDDFELDAVSLRPLFSGLAGIALVHIRQLHAPISNLLHCLREFFDLLAILFIGRSDM